MKKGLQGNSSSTIEYDDFYTYLYDVYAKRFVYLFDTLWLAYI